MKQNFDVETQLLKGGRGDFEVSLDEQVIFSKRSLGRFPNPDEVESLIAERLAG